MTTQRKFQTLTIEQEEPWCRRLNKCFVFSGFLSCQLRRLRRPRQSCQLRLKLFQMPTTALTAPNVDVGAVSAVGAEFFSILCPWGMPLFYIKPLLQAKPKKKCFITLHQIPVVLVSSLHFASSLSFTLQLILFSMCSYQAFRYLESRLCFKSCQVQLNHNIKPLL